MSLREKLKWLDPFHYVDVFIMPRINPNNNELVSWVVYIFFAFIFAWAIYTGLGLLLGTGSPMVIVVSGSMEPVFFRGDVIVLHGTAPEEITAPLAELDELTLKNVPLSSIATPVYGEVDGRAEITEIDFKNGKKIPVQKTGNVIVYFSEYRQQPIIHRAVAKLHARDGYYFLTKGDSIRNNTVDQDCGDVAAGIPERNCIALYPVPFSEIDGKAVAQIPLVGCVKLWVFDDLPYLISKGRLSPDFRGVC